MITLQEHVNFLVYEALLESDLPNLVEQQWEDAAKSITESLFAMEDVAIIKLAESATIDLDGRQVFSEGSDVGTVEVDPHSGVIYNDTWEWTSDEAMEVGRQWISAAVVAGPNRTVKS